MKLKVCGMRNPENLTELITENPDFIGFIFHEKSLRNIVDFPTIKIPKSISKVGVFVNETQAFILDKIMQHNLDFIQLHGNESPEYCARMQKKGIKIIKAFNINEEFNFDKLNKYEQYCTYFLFDAFGKNVGGNGITFDWSVLAEYKGDTAFLLSGGINESMAKDIKDIGHTKLAGIDINSQFETAPGLKDISKIKKFTNELYNR